MQIKELGHVVLYVRDLERSAAFYRDVLGFRQVWADGPGPTSMSSTSWCVRPEEKAAAGKLPGPSAHTCRKPSTSR